MTYRKREGSSHTSRSIILLHPMPIINRTQEYFKGYLPLGLLSIGTELKKNGFDVQIIDMRLGVSDSFLLNSISDIEPLAVGISCNGDNLRDANRVSQLLKKEFPNLFIAIGGHYATFKDLAVLKSSRADCVVRGEGEITFSEVVKCLDKKASISTVKGISVIERDQVVRTPSRPFLNDFQVPDRKLVDTKEYGKIFEEFGKRPRIHMETSRGCFNHCVFCAYSPFWRFKFRGKRPKLAISELTECYSLGFDLIEFCDGTFSADLSRAKKICKEIIRNSLQIDWTCETRCDCVDEELLNIMEKAGCKKIFYGVESLCQRTLNGIQKNLSVEDVKRAIKKTLNTTIKPSISMILGLPFDTHKTLKKSLEYVLSLAGIVEIEFNSLVLIPGSRLHSDPNKYKVTELKRWEDFPHPLGTIFTETVELPKKSLQEIWLDANIKYVEKSRNLSSYERIMS